MKWQNWNICGIPLIGVILPFLGRRRIHLNRDGSFVDTGQVDIRDERGFYYVQPWVFEWLGFGWPLTQSNVFLTSTGEAVDPEFETVGG